MDITSLGTDYASELATNALKNAKDSELSKKDLSNASDEELMDACKQFEEYFVEQIFKSALKSTTLLSNDDSGATYLNTMKDYYRDQYSREMATEASKTGQIGLAQELYDQMKKSQGVTIEEALRKKMEKESEETHTS
ncbi:MAG: rod-binding protein [Lachnospiraceae bacterium]|nr:rod-binding protein [Lachnospiraceae bacterium]